VNEPIKPVVTGNFHCAGKRFKREKAIQLNTKDPEKLQKSVPHGKLSGKAEFHSKEQPYLVSTPKIPAIPI
jgi:hypothetical protein